MQSQQYLQRSRTSRSPGFKHQRPIAIGPLSQPPVFQPPPSAMQPAKTKACFDPGQASSNSALHGVADSF
ncbi:hypothetical protein QT972_12560 [Microcoleus sp. herbarium7]|uniref:hypothetical protein n=1 Tax=unclassified Microcoleus TaxID=2642155 RepID=UPI002FD449ED